MDNQASEDDLYSKLLNLRLTVWRQTNLNGQANLDHDSVEEVLALIRTEKLKLLAEVRERVIGEDEVFVDLPIVDGTGKTISIVDRSFTTYMVVKNQLRAEQRTKLAKLEAEL